MANDDGQASWASPPSAHHLAEAVRAGHHGAGDALENQPAADATMLSQTEQTLIARAREHATAIRQEAAASLNAVQAEIAGRRALFTQQRFEDGVRGIEAAMRGMLSKHGGELEQRVYDALRARREYAFFNYENKLSADPSPDKWQFILFFLVVPLVIESLLNGNFFAEASDFGLIGGAATAVIISALNIALGFCMGVGPARYCQHVKGSHLFWALPAYAGMIALIVLFNLAVGHYREMLIANPDARSFQVMPRLMENPLAIYDIKSVALVIIGCLVAFVAATKGYSAFGTYPGQASAYKRWRQRWSAVEEERRRLDATLLPELEAVRGRSDGFREDCHDELRRLQGVKAAAETARDLYLSRLGQLRAAKDAAMMQYREANLRVRTDLPPAYFTQSLNLAEIDQPAELPEYVAVRRLIEDFEQQLTSMPALIEAKLKERLTLLRGVDLAGRIEQVKLTAAQAGREAFERDEAARKQAAEDFAATRR
ncbi:hypothetical protein [Bosea sp. (in: a-proteobacteria)]|uniref:hypothetical protein n=1 Tax=Bosea sp. (in: a-proteobacteria) TaxID=1871050 RepID=UPI00262574DC|nr:hypothetical protein [Bosea sp. (in: a-proteobacteria)]MCO5092606.1 hypothetical protein [Bosea sp. (in: a-proteobacteria)]